MKVTGLFLFSRRQCGRSNKLIHVIAPGFNTLWRNGTAVGRVERSAPIGANLRANAHAKTSVIPAKAGIHKPVDIANSLWIPAFAGMTEVVLGAVSRN
jgi:hypothetical protein